MLELKTRSKNDNIKNFSYNAYMSSFKLNDGRKIAGHILFFGLLVLCLYLVYTQWTRYKGKVTHISIESTGFGVWNSPFPAVTICNVNVVHKTQSRRMAAILQKHGYKPEQIQNFFKNLNKLINCFNCEYNITENFDVNMYEDMFALLKSADYTVNKIMKEVTHTCEGMVKKCIWKTKTVPCEKLFRLVKSTNGYCCTFNFFGFTDFQYDEEQSRYYAGIRGKEYGLTVVLDAEKDEYTSTLKQFIGFYVLVHDGYDVPSALLKGKALPRGKELSAGVSVEVLESEQDVQYLEPYQRGCLYKTEGNLERSKIYSYYTCINECRSRAMNTYCKCIPFYLNEKAIYRECTLADTMCLQQRETKYGNLLIPIDAEDPKLQKRSPAAAIRCNCLPNCNEVKYSSSYKIKSTAKLGYEANTTILNVFYSDGTGIRRVRKVIVTWDFLLASIGGVFGFCLSGSLITFFEILYHTVNSFAKKKEENENIIKVKMVSFQEDNKYK